MPEEDRAFSLLTSEMANPSLHLEASRDTLSRPVSREGWLTASQGRQLTSGSSTASEADAQTCSSVPGRIISLYEHPPAYVMLPGSSPGHLSSQHLLPLWAEQSARSENGCQVHTGRWCPTTGKGFLSLHKNGMDTE